MISNKTISIRYTRQVSYYKAIEVDQETFDHLMEHADGKDVRQSDTDTFQRLDILLDDDKKNKCDWGDFKDIEIKDITGRPG